MGRNDVDVDYLQGEVGLARREAVLGGVPLFGASFFVWVLMLLLVQGQHYAMALIDRVLDVG